MKDKLLRRVDPGMDRSGELTQIEWCVVARGTSLHQSPSFRQILRAIPASSVGKMLTSPPSGLGRTPNSTAITTCCFPGAVASFPTRRVGAELRLHVGDGTFGGPVVSAVREWNLVDLNCGESGVEGWQLVEAEKQGREARALSVGDEVMHTRRHLRVGFGRCEVDRGGASRIRCL